MQSHWGLGILTLGVIGGVVGGGAGFVAHGRALNEGMHRSPASLLGAGAGSPSNDSAFAHGEDYESVLGQFGAQSKHEFFSTLFPANSLGRALTQFAVLTEAYDSGDPVVRKLSRDASDFLRAQPEESFSTLAERLGRISSSRYFVEKHSLLRFATELQVDGPTKVALLARELSDRTGAGEGEDASTEEQYSAGAGRSPASVAVAQVAMTPHAMYVSAALEGLMQTSVDRQALVPVLREVIRSRRGRKAKDSFMAAVRGYSKDLAEHLRGY